VVAEIAGQVEVLDIRFEAITLELAARRSTKPLAPSPSAVWWLGIV
jgi:hypothetical protein